MTKELIVDGQIFIPTTVLAVKFSYTSDYLSKLAREEKIFATRVGRQWFVNEESLQKFIADSQEQKAKRSEELRLKRKLERQQFESTSVVATVATIEASGDEVVITRGFFVLESLLQSVVVLVCGFLVGVLGYSVYAGNVESEYLAQGLKTVGGDVVRVVSLDPIVSVAPTDQMAALRFTAFFDWLFKDVTQEDAQNVISVDQKLMLMMDGSVSTTTVSEIRESFSDEVEVNFDGPNTGKVTPVFKEKTDESYRFLLVPVANGGEN